MPPRQGRYGLALHLPRRPQPGRGRPGIPAPARHRRGPARPPRGWPRRLARRLTGQRAHRQAAPAEAAQPPGPERSLTGAAPQGAASRPSGAARARRPSMSPLADAPPRDWSGAAGRAGAAHRVGPTALQAGPTSGGPPELHPRLEAAKGPPGELSAQGPPRQRPPSGSARLGSPRPSPRMTHPASPLDWPPPRPLAFPVWRRPAERRAARTSPSSR